jgi:Rod binding domain-containing protein
MDAAKSSLTNSLTAAGPSRAATVKVAAAHTGDPRTAAQEFESFFLTQTLENMFAGIGSDTLFGGGQGEAVYRSLLLQEYGKAAAQAGGIGVADAVQREMLRMQEIKR